MARRRRRRPRVRSAGSDGDDPADRTAPAWAGGERRRRRWRARREFAQRDSARVEDHHPTGRGGHSPHRNSRRWRLGKGKIDMTMAWVLISLLWLFAGVISGLFGVGGAVVIIPRLVLIAGLQQHTAHGTSLPADPKS